LPGTAVSAAGTLVPGQLLPDEPNAVPELSRVEAASSRGRSFSSAELAGDVPVRNLSTRAPNEREQGFSRQVADDFVVALMGVATR
jgi:hypothetical protein